MAKLSNPSMADAPLIGSITIELYLTPNGITPAYGFTDIDKSAAIGHLITVTDRLREERKFEWATCPECKEPWSHHDPDYAGEDDPDDEELGYE